MIASEQMHELAGEQVFKKARKQVIKKTSEQLKFFSSDLLTYQTSYKQDLSLAQLSPSLLFICLRFNHPDKQNPHKIE